MSDSSSFVDDGGRGAESPVSPNGGEKEEEAPAFDAADEGGGAEPNGNRDTPLDPADVTLNASDVPPAPAAAGAAGEFRPANGGSVRQPNNGPRAWKGLALVAGIQDFEDDWKTSLPHARKDAGLVSETLYSLGFQSVIDLSNELLYTKGQKVSHRCGQLSKWELLSHIKNAASAASDGVFFLYLSTHGVCTMPMDGSTASTRCPDALATYEGDSSVKLVEFIASVGSAVSGCDCETVVVLDLSVPTQCDSSLLPNLSAACPPGLSVMLSLTPAAAPMFTLQFLQALQSLKVSSASTRSALKPTLKSLAWSKELSTDLTVIARAAAEQERRSGVRKVDAVWKQLDWIPVTAAADVDDSSLSAALASPNVADWDEKEVIVLVTLTKRVTSNIGNLPLLLDKIRACATVIGLSDTAGRHTMQPLQAVAIVQASSTPLKAWADFRSRYDLNTTELQRCEKGETVGNNSMGVYFKFGDTYEPGAQGEQEWTDLELVYAEVQAAGRDFLFGTDPQAGLDKDCGTETTELACRVKSLSLRLEATFHTSLLSYARLVSESRHPANASALLHTMDGPCEMEVCRLRNALLPTQTGVRAVADTMWHRKLVERTEAAKKMSIAKALTANQHGLAGPCQENTGLANFLQISQEAQIESAIRIQSVVRMFFGRKMYRAVAAQMGMPQQDGREVRRMLRGWLIAASRGLHWRPLSPAVVVYCESGVQRGLEAADAATFARWNSVMIKIKENVVNDLARELQMTPERVKLDGVNGIPCGQKIIVRIRIAATWVGPGDQVPEAVRIQLSEDAQQAVNAFQYLLKQPYGVLKAAVAKPRPVAGAGHLSLATLTPEKAVQSVLTGRSAAKEAGLPPGCRKRLEACFSDPATLRDNVVSILAAQEPSPLVPDGWRRIVLEAPFLPGNAVCKLPEQPDAALQNALLLSPAFKMKSNSFCHFMDVYNIFEISRLRGEEAVEYEIPGIRQLDKTPMAMHNKYWADRDYYDVPPDDEIEEQEQLNLMLNTVRQRRFRKLRYRVHLFSTTWGLAVDQLGGRVRTVIAWILAFCLVLVTGYLILLIPRWVSNVTAQIYMANMSQLSLEQIVTWLLVYAFIVMAALFVTASLIAYLRNKFAYKLRTLLVYISAKYAKLVSAQFTHQLREHDLRLAVCFVFETIPKIILSTFLFTACYVMLSFKSLALALLALCYTVVKFALSVAYDRFMIRHMVAISNIEKEEQLRWVVLRGKRGAAGHVVAQAADVDQMRLSLFSREKRRVNASNMLVHTMAAVADWLLTFSFPAFALYVGANEVADTSNDSDNEMAQEPENLPHCFFYYILLLLSLRLFMQSTVSMVESRPYIIRLVTVLQHVHLTKAEKAEMEMLLKLDDDKTLARELKVGDVNPSSGTLLQPPLPNGAAEADVEMTAVGPDASNAPAGSPTSFAGAPAGVTLQQRGWYRKKMLLKFDWFDALMAENPLSPALLYICFLLWVALFVGIALFVVDSWEHECVSINATCKVLDHEPFGVSDVSLPQAGDLFGNCELLHPIAYSLRVCANQIVNASATAPVCCETFFYISAQLERKCIDDAARRRTERIPSAVTTEPRVEQT
ncbi:hypothetical protein DIPPA_03117 [Diplonema papillatum]|nr:hypothetical protein DIPPA_03117 [Diplonema papillatum]